MWGDIIISGVGIGSNPRGHFIPADIPLPLSQADLYPPLSSEQGVFSSLIHRHWHSACEDGADAVASGCIAASAPDLRSTNRSTVRKNERKNLSKISQNLSILPTKTGRLVFCRALEICHLTSSRLSRPLLPPLLVRRKTDCLDDQLEFEQRRMLCGWPSKSHSSSPSALLSPLLLASPIVDS